MWCAKCKNNFPAECICPDLEEKLKKFDEIPNFVYKKCSVCSKHYALCKCKDPIFVLSTENQNEFI